MFRISCFADEISPELHEQIEVMKRNNIRYVEFRGVWNKNVLDLDNGELDTVKSRLSESGIKVSSIGSPIGKIDIKEDFNEHLQKFKRAVEIAEMLESSYIRIFSFYIKKPERDGYGETVLNRMEQMLRIAAEHNIRLLHENEADIYGESSVNCRKLFDSINNEAFRAVFDPSNFVAAGEEVFSHSFVNLKEYIEYMHIKDSVKGTGEIVAAGCGDGRIREILHELRNKEGMFLSLEPHLAKAGKFRGFTGPELFEKALAALRTILQELEIAYE